MTATESVPEFEALLENLKTTRGFDFTAYKRSTLTRRVDKRMQAVGVASYTDYADYLEVHPDEYTALFNTILINVTRFFRDPPVWDYVRDDVVPRILQDKGAGAAVRVWCAGCASGEEAYTLAIVIAEIMGVDAFRSRVKIYATDVDDDALSVARHGVYRPSDLEDVPEPLREKYFENSGERCSFRKDLRRSIMDTLMELPPETTSPRT